MRSTVARAVLLFAAIGVGCNTLIGIDEDYVVGEAESASGIGSATGGSSSSGSGGAGTGGASTSGSVSSSGSGGAPNDCPTALGPAMIDVGNYCVDSSEVTNAQYAEWLARNPDVAGQPAMCTWNTTFTPSSAWPAPGGNSNLPVVFVDWCDARAFCEAAGKRLCGKIGGGALAYDEYADSSKSQWYNACSAGGTTAYPYGDEFVGDACDGVDFSQADHLVAAKQMIDCHGSAPPFSEVYDMSGNVHEWEDSCAADVGSNDACRRRGGSFKDKQNPLRCDSAAAVDRGTSDTRTGFRCCADRPE